MWRPTKGLFDGNVVKILELKKQFSWYCCFSVAGAGFLSWAHHQPLCSCCSSTLRADLTLTCSHQCVSALTEDWSHTTECCAAEQRRWTDFCETCCIVRLHGIREVAQTCRHLTPKPVNYLSKVSVCFEPWMKWQLWSLTEELLLLQMCGCLFAAVYHVCVFSSDWDNLNVDIWPDLVRSLFIPYVNEELLIC